MNLTHKNEALSGEIMEGVMKKVENWCYVLSTELNGEVLYLTEKYKFDKDIQEALKAKNLITAQFIKSNIFQKYKYDLEIVLLKTTYEWR